MGTASICACRIRVPNGGSSVSRLVADAGLGEMCARSSGGDTESVAWESEGLLERDDVARPVLPGELLCFRDLRLRHVFGDIFLAFVSARLALRGSDI